MMRARDGVVTIAIGLLATVPACKASVQAEASTSGGADGFADFDEQAVEDERSSVNDFAEQVDTTDGDSLLGARHDIFLKDGVEANCRCLSIVAAAATDPRIGWEREPPAVDAKTQMVVAFQSQVCPEANDANLGASYRGYRTEKGDVVILVERAAEGRPKVLGAIIPKPASSGRVLVEPFPKDLPYGRALGDEQPNTQSAGRCVLTTAQGQ